MCSLESVVLCSLSSQFSWQFRVWLLGMLSEITIKFRLAVSPLPLHMACGAHASSFRQWKSTRLILWRCVASFRSTFKCSPYSFNQISRLLTNGYQLVMPLLAMLCNSVMVAVMLAKNRKAVISPMVRWRYSLIALLIFSKCQKSDINPIEFR